MKIWAALQGAIIVGVLVIGFIFMGQTSNCGIVDIKTVDDFKKMDSIVDSYISTVPPKEKSFSCIEKSSMLYHSERQVFIVTPTNSMRQYYGSFTQLVMVDQVIEGDDNLVDKKINMVITGGLTIRDNKACLETYGGKNIMLPENSYLVFCEKSEISDYLDIPMYRANISELSYLNLSSDYSLVKDKSDNTPYSLYQDSEYCYINQEALDMMLKYKKEIIDQFITKAK